MQIKQALIFNNWNEYQPKKKILGLTPLARLILTLNSSGINQLIILCKKKNPEKKAALLNELSSATDKPNLLFIGYGEEFAKTMSAFDEKNQMYVLKANLIISPEASSYIDKYRKALNGPLFFPAESDHKKNSDGILIIKTKNFKILPLKFISKEEMEHRFSKNFIETAKYIKQKKFFCLSIDSQNQIKKAEQLLLQTARKKSDGLIYRKINRPISLYCTKWLLKTKITPNQISIINLLPGLLSAFLITQSSPISIAIAGILFQISSIIDGCDGENARLTYRSSPKGAKLDTTCDIIVYFLFLLTLPIGLYRRSGELVYIIAGTVTLLSITLLYYQMTLLLRRIKKSGSMVHIISSIKKEAQQKKDFLAKFLATASALLRRDFFSFMFMLFCLSNSMEALQVLVTTAVPISTILLSLYNIKKRNRRYSLCKKNYSL